MRRLLSAAAMYGLADIAVLAVGGFLLLPLYTRALSQAEFGTWVAVRANVDLLTYVLHLGVPSAVARVYFDYRAQGQGAAYVSSVLNAYLVAAGVAALLAFAFGAPAWEALSPGVPAWPHGALALAVAATGFFGALAVVWLRMEGLALRTLMLQVGAALLLAAGSASALLAFDAGVPGLLVATLAAGLFSAVALPRLFGGGWRPRIEARHVRDTLRFALPVLVGYLAYFVLMRFGVLVLQRHAPAQELAVYGVAQQLALILAIASTSFGMALQPAVYAAEAPQVPAMLRQAARVLLVTMLAAATALMLFAPELIALVAPPGYAGAVPLLLVLALGNFCNAFSLVSDTALLQQKRVAMSVGISLASALVTAVLSLWLIPHYHAWGAAWAAAGGLAARMVLAHLVVYRLTGFATPVAMAGGLAAAAGVALAAQAVARLGLPPIAGIALKGGACALAAAGALLFYRNHRSLHA